MFRHLHTALPTFPGHPARPSRRIRPTRLPQVLFLTTTALLFTGALANATPQHQASAPAAAPRQVSPPTSTPSCAAGELCLWVEENYSGTTRTYDLRTANPGDCIPLPGDFAAHSFGNRLTRDVTIYQGADCSTEGDFVTYPGGGTYVPQAPFVVRAVKLWA